MSDMCSCRADVGYELDTERYWRCRGCGKLSHKPRAYPDGECSCRADLGYFTDAEGNVRCRGCERQAPYGSNPVVDC